MIKIKTKPKRIRIRTKPVVLVDSSYFSFYRFHATRSWWGKSHPEFSSKQDQDWLNNPEFMEKYISKFQEHVGELAKQLNIPLENLIFARDCHQDEIWRSQIFPAYKAHRATKCEDPSTGSTDVGPGPVIKYSNEHILSKGPMKVLRVVGAEADDIIATLVLYFQKTQPFRDIWIIANDTDFYQLMTDCKTKIFKLGAKLQLKPILPPSDPREYLEIKVLSGDKTDGIPPIFKGCGPVTARNLVRNLNTFRELLNNNTEAEENYRLNRKLIDFNQIPLKIREKILEISHLYFVI